jgi:hypothetical protein
MLNLPIDIIRHIYTFESTKKDNFAKVIHQLKMRQVFYELYHCYLKDYCEEENNDKLNCVSQIHRLLPRLHLKKMCILKLDA